MKRSDRSARKGQNGRAPSLKRLPRDFSWKLLRLVFGTLSDECSEGFRMHFDYVVKTKSNAAYHDLKAQWGLQSKNSAGRECARQLATHLLLVSCMAKNPALESVSAAERRANCIKGVLSNEARLVGVRIPIDSVLSLARNHVLRFLGRVPDLTELYQSVKHGPGTTVHREFGHTSGYFKYSEWPYHVGPGARLMLQAAITSDERWMGALEDSYRRRYGIPCWEILHWPTFWTRVLKVCPYNRVAVVPKDGTKDRPIAIEPEGNVLLQLGVDRMIRRRLREAGLDLNDQAPNALLAKEGCADTALKPITLDLSDASDTVSRELVALLLPPDWFTLLDSIRSPWGVLPDGTALRYAKMSSMGNGSTFVLETLVFYALLLAVSDRFGDPSDHKYIRAYGDDLIVPKYLARHVVAYLGLWGFKVNTAKSFLTGPIRESCGSDYWRGSNVRAVFFKKEPSDIAELLGMRNRLHRWFVSHYGCSLPTAIDSFFESYAEGGWASVPVGPENDDEFDTFLHSVRTYAMREFVSVRAIGTRPVHIPAGELHFRKLMHDLANVESPGGRFEVTIRGKGTLCRSDRILYRSFYRTDGFLQDHARPRYRGGDTPASFA